MKNINLLDFGKKEKVLNYACQTYQLSRPSKVGEVMDLIRKCQPNSFQEWENFYFQNATTKTKNPSKISLETLNELGIRLYEKVTEVVIPEWSEAFRNITQQDCINYIYNLVINRTFDGYLREKSVINDELAKIFPNYIFEESPPELDHAGDIDYLIKIRDNIAIGLQIKPTTASANFANYSLSERLQNSFDAFTEKFKGKVFIIFSSKVGNKKIIANSEVIEKIREEIQRLEKIYR